MKSFKAIIHSIWYRSAPEITKWVEIFFDAKIIDGSKIKLNAKKLGYEF